MFRDYFGTGIHGLITFEFAVLNEGVFARFDYPALKRKTNYSLRIITNYE